MFLSLAQLYGTTEAQQAEVLRVNALQLNRWLEEVWATGGTIPPILGTPRSPFLGDVDAVAVHRLPATLLTTRASGVDTTGADNFTGTPGPTTDGGLALVWDHLVYAYLVESTGIMEVFAEVVRRLLIGETLSATLTGPSVEWLRTTEDLFFKDPPIFAITGVVSQVRPQARANRRNAYWRMFGMDLPHPVPGRWGSSTETAWKADTGAGVNTDFRAKWTELLRQVWLGVENLSNSSGAKPTDPEYLRLLCEALRDMMNNRRRGGQLAREEFAYVATASWFHLTVASSSPIVTDLQCAATNPADRLAALANRVGMQSAARSRELFDLARPMSRFLRAIELGVFDTGPRAEQLFTDATLRSDLTTIIDNWQSATGERVKERPTGSVPPPSAQPLRVPTPAPGVPATNGVKA
jgi:hypothetical protein